MVRTLILIFLIVLASASGIYWLHTNSGMMWFYFMERKVETSVTFFSIAIFLIFIALQFVLWLFYKLFSLPGKIKSYLQEKGYKDSIQNLSTLIISLYEKDYKSIVRLKGKFDKKYLSEDTLSFINSLPEKYEQDNIEDLRSNLLQMLTSPKTKVSALRQLISLTEHEKQFEDMYKFSSQLWELEKSETNAKNFLNALMLSEKWQRVDDELDKLTIGIFSKSLGSFISKTAKNSALAFAKYKSADKLKQQGDEEGALKLLTKAIKLNNTLYAALVAAAKIFIKRKEYSKLVAIVKELWKEEPSYILTNELFKLSEFYRPEKFLAIARKIHGIKPYHYESHILLAKAALEADQFDEASYQISEALARDKNQRACILMAEFCERTHGNKAETLNWLKSSIIAHKEDYNNLKWDTQNLKIINI